MPFFFKRKVILHLHGNDFNIFVRNLPFPLSWIHRIILRRVDTFIVLTTKMLEQNDILTQINRNIELRAVPNFYSHEFDQLTNSDCINVPTTGTLNLLYFSNILYSKGIVDLIFAVSRCAEDLGLEIKLKVAGEIMGDGHLDYLSMKSYFEDLIKDKAYIEFLGVVRDIARKKELFSNAHIFTLPTFYPAEAFPLSLIEAMPLGMPLSQQNTIILMRFFPQNRGYLLTQRTIGI